MLNWNEIKQSILNKKSIDYMFFRQDGVNLQYILEPITTFLTYWLWRFDMVNKLAKVGPSDFSKWQ